MLPTSRGSQRTFAAHQGCTRTHVRSGPLGARNEVYVHFIDLQGRIRADLDLWEEPHCPGRGPEGSQLGGVARTR